MTLKSLPFWSLDFRLLTSAAQTNDERGEEQSSGFSERSDCLSVIGSMLGAFSYLSAVCSKIAMKVGVETRKDRKKNLSSGPVLSRIPSARLKLPEYL